MRWQNLQLDLTCKRSPMSDDDFYMQLLGRACSINFTYLALSTCLCMTRPFGAWPTESLYPKYVWTSPFSTCKYYRDPCRLIFGVQSLKVMFSDSPVIVDFVTYRDLENESSGLSRAKIGLALSSRTHVNTSYCAT